MRAMKIMGLVTAFTISGFVSSAQLSKAKVSYKIEFDADDPQMKMQLGMMGNSTMTMWFNGDLFRQEMDMGGMSKNITIMNNAQKKGLLLIDVPMQGMKMAVPMDNTDENKDDENDDAEVELVKETVEIAGYTCKKYIITDEDGNEMIMYTTEDIKKQQGGRFSNGKVTGFPLKIEIDQSMFRMIMTAEEVTEKYKEDDMGLFSLEIPEGYEEGTPEDLENMRGGM